MAHSKSLPPGQQAIAGFPRFGMTHFAARFPARPHELRLRIRGDIQHALETGAELQDLPRIEQTSDFHCVTTWSRLGLNWSGIRFRDFYERIVLPRARPESENPFVIFRCGDGYQAGFLLEDLLRDDVLLADRMNGEPLTVEHGAPLRLVSPAQYGYMNPKHLKQVEFWRDDRTYRPPGPKFMHHPRARVALEERGRVLPGWLLRHLYRPLIKPTVRRFRREMERHRGPLDPLGPEGA